MPVNDGIHANTTGTELHEPYIRSESDPGAVGAGKVWLKESSGEKKRRNAANDGWVDDAGAAGVSGPASSTDHAIVRFDGTDGNTLQNSSATVDDSGILQAGGYKASDGTAGATATTGGVAFKDGLYTGGTINAGNTPFPCYTFPAASISQPTNSHTITAVGSLVRHASDAARLCYQFDPTNAQGGVLPPFLIPMGATSMTVSILGCNMTALGGEAGVVYRLNYRQYNNNAAPDNFVNTNGSMNTLTVGANINPQYITTTFTLGNGSGSTVDLEAGEITEIEIERYVGDAGDTSSVNHGIIGVVITFG